MVVNVLIVDIMPWIIPKPKDGVNNCLNRISDFI